MAKSGKTCPHWKRDAMLQEFLGAINLPRWPSKADISRSPSATARRYIAGEAMIPSSMVLLLLSMIAHGDVPVVPLLVPRTR